MSFRKWAARSAVAVAAAVVVSVGATSGPAGAVVVAPPPPIPPVVTGGLVTGGIPAVGACVASVVCAAGVGLLVAGTAAYMTRDTWVPWVKGLLPGGGPDNQTLVSGHMTAMGQVTQVNPQTVAFNVLNTDTQGYVKPSPRWTQTLICGSGGVYTVHTINAQAATMNPSEARQYTPTCGAGSVVVALVTTQTPGYTDYYSSPGNFVRWGSTESAAKSGAEKAVKYKVLVDCVTPAGDPMNTADDTINMLTVEYEGVEGGFVYPSCKQFDKGEYSKGVKVDAMYPGGSTYQRIWEAQAPADPAYPQCSNGLPCRLEVYVNGQPCQVGSTACVDWMSRVQREGSTDYSCRWGPYTVSMVKCDALERTYRPGGAPLTTRNTDGNPDTSDSVNPDGSVGPAPGTGGSTGPVTVAPVPTPIEDLGPDPDGANCYPSGTAAFNPVEWVVRPVKCALVWAFVPSTVATQTAKDTLTARIEAVGMGPIITALGESFSWVGAGAGCTGPTIEFAAAGVHESIQPFNACADPMRTAAEFSRALSSVVIGVSGALSIARAIASAFGLNFSMGRGQEAAA